MKEKWLPISGYEGLYEISTNGNVKMLGRKKRLRNGSYTNVPSKIISQYIVMGYKRVKLRNYDGKTKMESVHRLVAMTFIPNPNNYTQVNHKDEVKTNNSVFVNDDGSIDLEKSNLEWCTAKYNSNYGTGIKRCSEQRYKHVMCITSNGTINAWISIKHASKDTGIAVSNISSYCNGRYSPKNGSKWCFI